jgi:hypothetical protein
MLAFRMAFGQLERRIKTFVSLPVEALDQITLKRRVAEIVRVAEPAAGGAGA